MTVREHTAEILGPSFPSCLPNPISPFSLLVTIGESSVNDLPEVTNPKPDTSIGRLFNSEANIILKGVQRRLDDSNVVAIYISLLLLS